MTKFIRSQNLGLTLQKHQPQTKALALILCWLKCCFTSTETVGLLGVGLILCWQAQALQAFSLVVGLFIKVQGKKV